MLQPGARIDRYEILAPIAGGGMGMVYRVRHSGLGDELAMKVLLPNYASSEKVRARFKQEAQVQSQLRHPSIVHVSDLLEVEGLLAMVMDLIHGPSLEQVLTEEKPGPWSMGETMAVLGPVLDAMAHAHGRGVAHRDLKPANVMLERSDGSWPGLPRVTDFGLAKLLASEGGMTKTGAMMGTLPYMAPEQFRGHRAIDARADVFALGMMLWRMLSGLLPVNPEDMAAVAFMYTGNRAIPRLDEVGAAIPPAVVELVARCVSIDAAERPADAGALVGELGRVGAGRRAPVAPTRLEEPAPARRVVGGSTVASQWLDARTPPPSRADALPMRVATGGGRWWQSGRNWVVIAAAVVAVGVLVRMESGRAREAAVERAAVERAAVERAAAVRVAADRAAAERASAERVAADRAAAERAAAERAAARAAAQRVAAAERAAAERVAAERVAAELAAAERAAAERTAAEDAHRQEEARKLQSWPPAVQRVAAQLAKMCRGIEAYQIGGPSSPSAPQIKKIDLNGAAELDIAVIVPCSGAGGRADIALLVGVVLDGGARSILESDDRYLRAAVTGKKLGDTFADVGMTYGPNDGGCCPSLCYEAVFRWNHDAGKLEQQSYREWPQSVAGECD